jgi:hypothetical protein
MRVTQGAETRNTQKIPVGMNEDKRQLKLRNRIKEDNTNMDREGGPVTAQSV